jgi:hypothetical protein
MSISRRVIVAAAAVSCVAFNVAIAQRAADVEKGVHVRITELHGKRFSGSLVSSTSDSVTVITDGAGMVRSMPSPEIGSFEVSTGRHRGQGALIKGAIGLGIGLASGALLAAASFSEPKAKQCTSDPSDIFGLGCALSNACFAICTRGEAAAAGGILGGASGLVIGTIVGAVQGRESWTVVKFR